MDGQLFAEDVADSASSWWGLDPKVDDESLVPFDEKEKHTNLLEI
jgi:hypothetical protein